MKRMFIGILVLSLLLAILTACGAQAQQPDEPEPAPQVDQTEPTQPEQPAEPAPEPIAEKPEISQEELETIFETVYATASENHPEDWSVDFQITDEIGKINSAIPDDKEAPSNLRSLYTDWRAAQLDTDLLDMTDEELEDEWAQMQAFFDNPDFGSGSDPDSPSTYEYDKHNDGTASWGTSEDEEPEGEIHYSNNPNSGILKITSGSSVADTDGEVHYSGTIH